MRMSNVDTPKAQSKPQRLAAIASIGAIVILVFGFFGGMELEKTSSNKTIAAMQADLNAANQKAASQFQAGYDLAETERRAANPGPLSPPEQRARDFDDKDVVDGNSCFRLGEMFVQFSRKVTVEDGIGFVGEVQAKRPPTNDCWPYGYPNALPTDTNTTPYYTFLKKKVGDAEVIVSWELSGNPAKSAYGRGRYLPNGIPVSVCVQQRIPQNDPTALVLVGKPICTEWGTMN